MGSGSGGKLNLGGVCMLLRCLFSRVWGAYLSLFEP